MALKRSAVRDRYAPPLLQAHPLDGLFCLWGLGLRGFVEACFAEMGAFYVFFLASLFLLFFAFFGLFLRF